MKFNKGLFVGFDNVLIYTNSGKPNPLHSDDWKFNTTVLDKIKEYLDKDTNYKICIVTQQLKISRGTLSEKSFLYRIEKVCKKLEEGLGLRKNSVCFNYVTNLNTYRSFPNSGMIYELALEYELDLTKSIFIGNTLEEEATVENIMKFIKLY